MSYVFQPERKILRDHIAHFGPALTGRVLDVGGGFSSRYKRLLTKAESYTNMEVVAGAGVDLIGHADAIPLADASIDGTLCTQVILEVYNFHQAIREMARVLVPGGKLLITFPFMGPLVDEPYDAWRFTPHSIKRMLEEAGFTIETIEKEGGFFVVRSQFLLRYLIHRFDVYQRWWRGLFNLFSNAYGRLAIWLDRHDKSDAGRIYTCGYTVLAVKNK